MYKNLVIVESPAKAKTIEKFLGKDYKVMSSYGHIRDLKKKTFSIDKDTFEPIYEIPSEKKKVVEELKRESQRAGIVWLASDEDREGEAISWHLYEVLGLDPVHTRRIVFHEITPGAIKNAIEHPRSIDTNLVYAQQARRVLDRIVGFKLSPVLWRRVKPALSAGRVQSVTVRLIVDREREIAAFEPTCAYRVVACFHVPAADGNPTLVKAELGTRFKTRQAAQTFLEQCKGATFTVQDVQTRPLKKSPALPFTTSTLQQEAARKLGFSVSQTMTLAQRLYESGQITYMRTDSTNLSDVCLGAAKQVIVQNMGQEYHKRRNIHAKIKGAQEAHEAIRPTSMHHPTITTGNAAERRLYDLIYKRTLASQMADALLEKTTVTIGVSGSKELFTATGEVITFDGFLRVYREATDDDEHAAADASAGLLPPISVGEVLTAGDITATERYTSAPQRYNEAALVHKLEELGIGRPSTYAPTISTIQQREYVRREDVAGTDREVNVMQLHDGTITSSTMHETYGSEKQKLIPTDVGVVVNDFLTEHFPQILDYNFTADIEKEFDEIAEGEKGWVGVIAQFDADFEPLVDKAMADKPEHKVGERMLGTDPVSGRPVSAKIGRYGPIVQIGSVGDTEKPRFAQLQKGQTIESITLEDALALCALPRTLGEADGEAVTVGSGRYGPYVRKGKNFISLPDNLDPITITLDEALKLFADRAEQQRGRILRTFDEDPEVQILNGPYGAYISSHGANTRLPRGTKADELTFAEVQALIEKAAEAPAKPRRPRAKK